MKSTKLIITIVLSISIIITSCTINEDCITGNGTIITEIISVPQFSGIIAYGGDNVTISQGDVQEVQVTGYPNIINRLKRNVNGNIWKIVLEDGCYRNSDLNINIIIPNFEQIELLGSGNIIVNDFTNQQDLNLEILGSGDIVLNANQGSENVFINIEGSGNVIGHSDFIGLNNLEIDIIGSGSYNGFPIKTDNCLINIEGSGNCNVYVNNNLDVNIHGSGNVNYKGIPTITQNITGSGTMNNAN